MLMTHFLHEPILTPLSPEVPDEEWTRWPLDRPSFLRHPRHLAMVDNDDELETDFTAPNVSETHWRPLAPRWTTDPPSRPGVYQLRPAGAQGYAFVLVYEQADGTLAWKPYPMRMTSGEVVLPAPRHGQEADYEWGDHDVKEPV
jgi:hypothetical protein